MTWFFAVVVVAVMGGVAVVAAGRAARWPRCTTTARTPGCPPTGRWAPQDLRRVRFGTALRGYRMSEVDALLDRLAAELEPPREARSEPRPRPARAPDEEA